VNYRRSVLSASETAGLCIAADAAPTFLKKKRTKVRVSKRTHPYSSTKNKIPYSRGSPKCRWIN